jgi:hypothetical protein
VPYRWIWAVLEADAELHLGRPRVAVDALSSAPDVSQGYQMRSWVRAANAEALVHARSERAETTLESAAESSRQSRIAAAIWARAAGLHRGDEDLLHAALAEFETLGMSYQAARTGYLCGGDHRSAAEQTMRRLGVPPPAEPAGAHRRVVR